MGQREVLDQLLVGRGLLERVEVGPVDVLDERLLERGDVVALADERRHPTDPQPAGRPPAALAGDELELVTDRPDEHRLEDADLTDRLGQLVEQLLVEALTRLVRVRPDRRGVDLAEPARRLRAGTGGDECPESLTQSAASGHCSPPWPTRGTPRRPARWGRTR